MYSISQRLGDGYVKRHFIELPEWLCAITTQKEQFDHVFLQNRMFTDLTQKQAYLKQLLIIFQQKVDFNVFVDFFKTINLLVAHPLTKAVFNLKIYPLYRIFKELSCIVFNEQTCKELAVLTPFFPSAHDIDKIMMRHMHQAQQNIAVLQQVIEQDLDFHN